MGKILEFTVTSGYLSVRAKDINAVDIDPNDAKCIRMFISGITYNIHFDSEESAIKTFKEITEAMKEYD